jgi:aquaporin Z
LGGVLGVAVYRLAGPRWLTIEVAKLYHFAHDRYGVLHRRG